MSSLKSYHEKWCHTPTLCLEISKIFNIFYFYKLSATTGKLYMNHIVSGVKFTDAGHVILQLILYKLWSKMLLRAFEPINCQFWHHSHVWLKEVSQDMVSHPYLMFTNKQDIKHFLYLLTFIYHWETSYEPHCQQCWVQFTDAGHVILQLILYKLWSKTLLWAFEPHKLPILTSQSCLAQRGIPRYGVTPLPYL